MCKVLKLLHGAVTFTMKWTFMRPDLMWLKREWYFYFVFQGDKCYSVNIIDIQ